MIFMYKRNRMDNILDPERVEEIAENSIRFPLFMNNGAENDTRIFQALYIDELGPTSPLLMPSSISIVRETADGWSTIGHYELVETVKEHTTYEIDKMN